MISYWVILKKKLVLCEAKMEPGNEIRYPLSKFSQYVKIRNHSGKLYQSIKKIKHHFPGEAG